MDNSLNETSQKQKLWWEFCCKLQSLPEIPIHVFSVWNSKLPLSWNFHFMDALYGTWPYMVIVLGPAAHLQVFQQTECTASHVDIFLSSEQIPLVQWAEVLSAVLSPMSNQSSHSWHCSLGVACSSSNVALGGGGGGVKALEALIPAGYSVC